MLRRLVTNKKSLVIVPVVMALVLAGLFLPVMKVSIEPYGRLSLESKITISIGYEVAYASPGWVTPTGEVLNGWGGPGNAWDDYTGTSSSYDAGKASWTPYLELTHAAIDCDRVQVWVSAENDNMATVEVDVYYGTAWDNIYSGAPTLGSFAEYAIGSEQSVTAMRIRCLNSHGQQLRFQYVHEADFYEVVPLPDITNLPILKAFGLVNTSTDYWSNDSAPTWPLDDGECFFTVTNNSSQAVNIAIKATDFSGGTPGWTLAGTPGADAVVLKAGKSGDSLETNMVTLTTSDQAFITALGASTPIMWELKMETPISFSNGDPKTSTITLTATFV